MSKLLPIGTVEYVSLPNDGIKGVPAKIDTGADGCAIWASNIELKKGALSFNFFAPGSEFYRPEPVITTAFKVANVRNSFGVQEFRYKIRLTIEIGSAKMTRWFSLADRSRNSYPILLGKNILRNHFVVDVSQRHVIGKKTPGPVLVIGSEPKLLQEFFDKVKTYSNQKVRYHCVAYQDILFDISSNQPVIQQLQSSKDVSEYAMVYFKSHNNHAEFASAIAQYLQYKLRPYVDSEIGNYVSASKLSEYMKLSCFNLPIPHAICAKTPVLKRNFAMLKKELGIPFVLKEINSDMGKNNYLISTLKEFKGILDNCPVDHVYLAQQYIENDGFYRIHVLGKEIGLAIWRSSHPHADSLKRHLNKPAGGANASLVAIDELPGEVKDISVRAANCMNREIAGIDIMQDKHTKEWYILEVNNAPQIRSGSFVNEKAKALARFFDNEVGS